ncbi:hypothetical protein ACO2Q8_16085 [Larkinella sp. VNQ87]|uniref:hypothetical protein n=1 Tax=Larkinella sp. VNQ87 TaxID=3400921 RepID=UPI003BFDAF11
MKTVTFLLIGLALGSLAGCQALRSNVSPDTQLSAGRRAFVSKAKPEAMPAAFGRVLVVLKNRQPDTRYAEQVMLSFPTPYQVCTMSLNPYEPAGHSEAIRARAAECQSEVVLTVEQTHKGSLVSLDAPDGDDLSQYNFKLRAISTNQTFWKGVAARPRLSSGPFPTRTLVARLLRDGVLTGELPQRAVAVRR